MYQGHASHVAASGGVWFLNGGREQSDGLRSEVGTNTVTQATERLFNRETLPIGTIGGHRVEGVGGGQE